MAGPVKVEKKLQGDFYDLHDLVQDTTLLSHASDTRPFACDSDDEAGNMAQSDYGEIVIEKILSHRTNPLLFELQGNRGESFWLPFKDVKFLKKVEAYCKDNKGQFSELKALKFNIDQQVTARTRYGQGYTTQEKNLSAYS